MKINGVYPISPFYLSFYIPTLHLTFDRKGCCIGLFVVYIGLHFTTAVASSKILGFKIKSYKKKWFVRQSLGEKKLGIPSQ